MRASPSQKLQLSILSNLGVPKGQLDQIRDQLHETDDTAVNGMGQVSISAVERAAKSVEAHLEKTGQRYVPLPAAAMHRILSKVPGDTLKIALDKPFATAEVRSADPVVHASTLDAPVSGKALGTAAQSVQDYLQKLDEDLAAALEAGTATVGQLATALGTPEARSHLGAKLDTALQGLGKVGGPAHTSQDVAVNLDSKFTHLDGDTKAGSIGIFQKRMIESMTVKRDKESGQFTLHAFENDKLVVTVPPGATVIMLDGAGNQKGARVRPERTQIGEETHNAVTISRSMIQHPDRKMFAQDPQFGVRIIDKSGDVLYERNMAFDAKASNTSKRVFSGQLHSRPSPETNMAEAWDHFNPDGRSNTAGVGERPIFTVDGQTGDRVRIERDGKNFDLGQWSQFLAPPRSNRQTFKTSKGFVHLNPPNTSAVELDGGAYSPTAGAKLRDSHGHGVTFDRSLHQTQQAHWGSQGLRIFDSSMRRVTGAFDPLTDAR